MYFESMLGRDRDSDVIVEVQRPDTKVYFPDWHEASEYLDKLTLPNAFPPVAPEQWRNMSYCAIGDRGVNEEQPYINFPEPVTPYQFLGGTKNLTPSATWLDRLQQYFRDYPSLLARLRGSVQ